MKRTALVISTALAGIVCLAVGGKSPPPVGSAESVLPPCYVPVGVDTTGWQTIRMLLYPFAFRIPAGFRIDSTAHFTEGGRKWSDGRRTFSLVNGIWGASSFGEVGPRCPGYSECEARIAGARVRLVTTYVHFKGGTYSVVGALPYVVPRSQRTEKGSSKSFSKREVAARLGYIRGYSAALIGQSPDSTDQRLFLAIIRTLRADSAE